MRTHCKKCGSRLVLFTDRYGEYHEGCPTCDAKWDEK